MEMSMNLLPFFEYKEGCEAEILDGYNKVLEKVKPEDIMTMG